MKMNRKNENENFDVIENELNKIIKMAAEKSGDKRYDAMLLYQDVNRNLYDIMDDLTENKYHVEHVIQLFASIKTITQIYMKKIMKKGV